MSHDPRPAWQQDLAPETVSRAAAMVQAAIDQGRRIVVVGHVSPDADALGSVLAMHEALVSRGAPALALIGEPDLHIPGVFMHLPHREVLHGDEALPDPGEVGLLITLDAAGPDRIGTARALLDAGVPTLMIDHHARGTAFGALRLIAPRAAATTVLVAALLEELGIALTPTMATNLYAGLVADTGRFGFASTDASTMRLAATLLEAGAEHVEVHRQLFATRSLPELALLAAALGRLTYVPRFGLVHTYVTPEELAASGANGEATEHLVDVVRWADVAEVTMVAKPANGGEWRVSLRSDGDTDVGAIASRFGGGGHTRASGFTRQASIDEVIAGVIAALEEG